MNLGNIILTGSTLVLFMTSCTHSVSDSTTLDKTDQINEGSPLKPMVGKIQLPASKKILPGEITGVDMGQVFTMSQGGVILLIDCRPRIFYHIGHIEGAINLPVKKYDSIIGKRRAQIDVALAEQKTIVLYCQNQNCPDAYAVAKKLVKLGYSVSIYKGGWEEWKRAGL